MAIRHFLNKSRFCLQHQDGRIRVWWHHVERTLAACICHHHAGSSPGMMVWGAIGYMSRLPLVRNDGTLNSDRYISGVLFFVLDPLFGLFEIVCFIRVMHDHMLR
ncbi:transposable element Tcb1 transposase [Trichonephila clavipes]|nr:transposable element Tcb1 transposase [Trichonephila clavipes]